MNDTLRISTSGFDVVNRAVVLSLFLGSTGVGEVSLCAFVSILPMSLMSIIAIDKTLKGPPVEVLVQWQARRWIHTFR